ncbi:DUF1007 family protein [Psychromonas sp. Urea-02u-13]|uniref:DUF1007 family protein n=1 Tax=Psychromonas sp. Urea-02u-13 TaxID=2058326 RepID=UPI000C34AACC|nr:DUF1007 family protein [Psychromonas sp. Urea-02u-13]PKG37945.1 DUF1007 domain-containing protein [Psychromonas sp. Urea-02u-13]
MHHSPFHFFRVIFYAFITLFLLQISTLKAHPHSWVSVFTEIEGNDKQLTGLTMFWTFDLITTSDALDGTNLSAENQQQTLQILASEMLANIKESHYFTHFKMHGQTLAFKTPQKATLVLEDYKLTLNFFLELDKPLPLPITELNLQIYEDSYFVDFLWLQLDDIQLSEHFRGDCQLNIVEPPKNIEQDVFDPLFSPSNESAPTADALAMYDPLFMANTKLGETFTQSVVINCL